MKVRRVLSFLLSLVLIWGLFVVPVSAWDDNSDSFQWNTTDPGDGNIRRGLTNKGGISLSDLPGSVC